MWLNDIDKEELPVIETDDGYITMIRQEKKEKKMANVSAAFFIYQRMKKSMDEKDKRVTPEERTLDIIASIITVALVAITLVLCDVLS